MAVSLTSTSRLAAAEANCSRLASGCANHPNTSICSRVAPSNFLSRWIHPVSRATTGARFSITNFKCSSTCDMLCIRLLLVSRRSGLISFPIFSDGSFSCHPLPLLKLVRMGTLNVFTSLLSAAADLGYRVTREQLTNRDAQGVYIQLLPNGKPILELIQP